MVVLLVERAKRVQRYAHESVVCAYSKSARTENKEPRTVARESGSGFPNQLEMLYSIAQTTPLNGGSMIVSFCVCAAESVANSMCTGCKGV